MGKILSYFSSWDNIKAFAGSFLKGALIGVPIALIVLGGFGVLNALSWLPDSIKGMNNLPALLTFNTIFGGASLAVNDALDRYKQPHNLHGISKEFSHAADRTVSINARDVATQPSYDLAPKRSEFLVSEPSHEGIATEALSQQRTIH